MASPSRSADDWLAAMTGHWRWSSEVAVQRKYRAISRKDGVFGSSTNRDSGWKGADDDKGEKLRLVRWRRGMTSGGEASSAQRNIARDGWRQKE